MYHEESTLWQFIFKQSSEALSSLGPYTLYEVLILPYKSYKSYFRAHIKHQKYPFNQWKLLQFSSISPLFV